MTVISSNAQERRRCYDASTSKSCIAPQYPQPRESLPGGNLIIIIRSINQRRNVHNAFNMPVLVLNLCSNNEVI